MFEKRVIRFTRPNRPERRRTESVVTGHCMEIEAGDSRYTLDTRRIRSKSAVYRAEQT